MKFSQGRESEDRRLLYDVEQHSDILYSDIFISFHYILEILFLNSRLFCKAEKSRMLRLEKK